MTRHNPMETDKPTRLLMILFNYPPSVGPDVARGAGFAANLGKTGFVVDVLTTIPTRGTVATPRAPSLTVPRSIVRLPRLEPSELSTTLSRKPRDVESLSRVRSIVDILKQFAVPDKALFWALLALPIAVFKMLRNRYHVVFASYFPASAIGIGLILKLLFPRLRLVVDLRDAWTIDPAVERSGLILSANRYLERQSMIQADACVFVNETMKSRFINRYPFVQPRAYAVYNGFETPLHIPKRPRGEREPVTIVHAGTLSETRTVDSLIRSLSDRTGPPVRLQCIGAFYSELPQAFIDSAIAKGVLSIHAYVPPIQLNSFYAGADALLVVVNQVPSAEEIATGKLFVYLAVQRPILVLGPPDGEAGRIVQKTSCGMVCDWGDPDCLETFLARLPEFEEAIVENDGPPAEFSHAHLASELAPILRG